ncbi:hypothetical protein BDV96DRAFT_509569 [Lophiotrema nucula]|uniref:GA4 desaturase n=1 Tax=Lophiotrema nucula TaxID=690887 RepID=A0A6A5YEI0_9PLEO|nr:hypothetical protein BDV96DRAFT_509569 [Lophiotrema nucula]
MAPTAIKDIFPTHDKLPTEDTTLYYYLELKDGGIIQTYPGTAFEKRRKHVPHDVTVKDMRSVRDQFNINNAGFELVDHKSAVKDFTDAKEVEQVYYAEYIDFIKKRVGGADRLTHVSEGHAAQGLDDKIPVKVMNPARFVHVDQSYRGAEQILFLNLPEEEAERRMKKRWAIINVWAPIIKPVKRDPVAFADFRSIDEYDFRTVVANLPPPDAAEYGKAAARYEVTNLAHNPNQQWYYASDMTPEEAWVFMIFDSKNDGRAKCAVHTFFPYQNQDDYGEPRTSVEVRCFVFWDDKETE